MDEVREGIRGFLNMMSAYPTIAHLQDVDSMSDDELAGELTVIYFEMSYKLGRESPDLDKRTVGMVIQGQIESFCGCTYEEIFEYFLKDYDVTKVADRLREHGMV